MQYSFPKGFVYLSDRVPDIIQDVRYYSTYNLVGARFEGYESPVIICTEEVADALCAVSGKMSAAGYVLKVFDAYRPQMAVDHIVRWAGDVADNRMKPYFYPNIGKDRIIPGGYVAPRSGHTRGSAIDLTLVSKQTGQELDMGTPFDFMDKRSNHGAADITPEQEGNRAILKNVMMEHGFLAYNKEWWHYVLKEEAYPDTYFNFKIN
ncbi:MAG: M15 family metallopeptidase [Defluviitaleaceae bacterium]|nr:M15 family metallopeptidase [Defluviitaleaceae bacterium]